MSEPFSNTPNWLDERFRDDMDRVHRRSRQPNNARWLQPGEAVEVQGFSLPGGMIYVGPRLTSVEHWFGNVEPALINPNLRAADRPSPVPVPSLGYRFSYAGLSAQSRSDYLQFLASGRRDPETPIDYVRLFFFGIERRIIHDLHGEFHRPDSKEAERVELEALIDELEALASVYRAHREFATQASEMVSVIETMLDRYNLPSPTPPPATSKWDLPEYLRFALGCFVQHQQPIPSAWALRWLRSTNAAKFRTPSKRAPIEFEELWHIHFAETFPEGFKVDEGRRKLDISYRPDTNTMLGVFDFRTALPDVAESKVAFDQLQALAASCEDELDAYSRYIGKGVAVDISLAARALLPPALIDNDDPALDALRSTIEGELKDEDFAVIDGTKLVQAWSPGTRQLSRPESQSLSNLMAALGVGVEPDPRFGGKPLSAGPAVLFRASQPSNKPSAHYEAALLLLDLATFVLVADGRLSAHKRDRISTLLAPFGLPAAELTRLTAHAEWISAGGATLTGLKARLRHAHVPAPQLGQVLIQVATSKTSVHPATITALTKVFRLLELDEATLFGAVHHASAGSAAGPVEHRQRAQLPDTDPPVQPEPKSHPFTVDMDRVQATMTESAAVAELLGAIFDEEEEQAAPAAPVNAADESLVEGLDGPHSALLRALAARSSWSGAEIEELSARLHLLPSGAIDTLNEVAFDRIGDPVCEFGSGTDIEVDLDIARELLEDE